MDKQYESLLESLKGLFPELGDDELKQLLSTITNYVADAIQGGWQLARIEKDEKTGSIKLIVPKNLFDTGEEHDVTELLPDK